MSVSGMTVLLVFWKRKSKFNDFCFLLFRVVEFASHSDLKNALDKLAGKEINGRKIKLIEAAKKRCV